jgi:hypothetical protein
VLEIDPSDKSLGALWRDVLNFLGDRELSPNDYLPLCEAVLPKWDKFPGYIGGAAGWLAGNRKEIDNSVAQNLIGWSLWTERRERLRAFAKKVSRRRVTDDDLAKWWLGRAYGEYAAWDGTRFEIGAAKEKKLQAILGLSEEQDRLLRLQAWHKTEKYSPGWSVAWLHSHLGWVEDLETLRRLARKTWPADVSEREGWTQAELEWVNDWYEDQQPLLMARNEGGLVDPFELEIWNDEQHIGFGMSDFSALVTVFMRATVIDFADEILERSKRGNARGSLSCLECGRFVGRRALGYGQLYCSDRCKKRVAKRRYRGRVAEKRTQPMPEPSPPDEPVYLRKAMLEGERA